MKLMQLYRNDRAAAISLSGREIAVLAAVRKNGRTGVCAADLQRTIAKETGKEPRLATLYGTIADLERKSLLATEESVLPKNGGRPRRLFKLTENGQLALSLGEAMVADSRSLIPA